MVKVSYTLYRFQIKCSESCLYKTSIILFFLLNSSLRPRTRSLLGITITITITTRITMTIYNDKNPHLLKETVQGDKEQGIRVKGSWIRGCSWIGTSVRRSSGRRSGGRLLANDVVAPIFISLFFPFFPVFPVPPSRPFLIEGVVGSKNLFSESCLEWPKTWG